MERDNFKKINPADIAKAFEAEIKDAISQKFSVSVDDLSILLEDEDGVYMSKDEPDTLCSLVVGLKNGFLYLATAKMGNGGDGLADFKVAIIS